MEDVQKQVAAKCDSSMDQMQSTRERTVGAAAAQKI